MIIKCKMCGGDLEFQEGMSVCECEFCGTAQTIPQVDNEKKLNLFNRANRLRMASEFDKAASVYESIVAEFPEEAEAYWGLCLCAYGIEYVDDPATGKKMPTCHRTRQTSIMDDSNFDMACENADAVAKKIYREEAKEIDRLQRDILRIVAGEEPYDVFICYKETDSTGGRTPDSVLAQDIYDALTAKGLKVFFARITLEDKLGQQYEPYIFAALHSAKVMLAIGTDYEYFDAVWVKNEWSRFLDMMKTDRQKTLIPCYKGIDAYDIPKEFRNLQAQDMGKLGWLQDLTRGVVKLCGKDQPQVVQQVVQQTVVQQVAAPAAGPQADTLIRRVFMALEDGDFGKADELCEQVLNMEPENARAYLGKLMAQLHVKKPEYLSYQPKSFRNNSNLEKAMRFGDEELVEQLQYYLRKNNEYLEEERKKNYLESALEKLEKARDLRMFPNAKEAAEKCMAAIAGTEEAKTIRKAVEEKKKELQAKQYQAAKALMEEKNWEKAAAEFGLIADCWDSAKLIQQCREMLQKEQEAAAEAARKEQEAAAAEAARKKRKIWIGLIAAVVVFSVQWLVNFKILPEKELADRYRMAEQMLEDGQYDDAYDAFEALGDYRDSAQRCDEVMEAKWAARNEKTYAAACQLMNEGKYEEAKEEFLKIGEYKDAAECVRFCETELARLQEEHVKQEKEQLLKTARGLKAGDVVSLGSLEWIVLEHENSKALLLAKDIVCRMAFEEGFEETSKTPVVWEETDMYAYLNTEFPEQYLAEYVDMLENVNGDKASLLWVDQYFRYEPYITKLDNEWWLRDIVEHKRYGATVNKKLAGKVCCACYVEREGNMFFEGIGEDRKIVWNSAGVRPVICLNTDKLQ